MAVFLWPWQHKITLSGYNARLCAVWCHMRVIRGLYNLPIEGEPSAVTIGNFDGVHRGHQAVFQALSAAANERGLPVSVVMFEPQPAEYFSVAAPPARLLRCREKLEWMRQQPIDQVVVLRFDQTLAEQSAEEFIQQVLVQQLRVKYLLVGDDFRFGRQRQGDYALLQAAARQHDFELQNLDSVVHGRRRVSSTQLREFLQAGDFASAEKLLGRPYRMSGRVMHGQKLGRDIGYPTINIPLRRRKSPLAGIYAVRVEGIASACLDGVASIGTRPTVNGAGCLLEVHLFDWQGDCYGQRADVEFVQFLRAEEKFEDIPAMIAQMDIDTHRAKEALQA